MRFVPWLLAGAMACRSVGSTIPSTTPARMPLARLRAHAGSFDSNSGLVDSARVVVRDTAEWRALWQRINQPFLPPPALPSIDFQRDMIIVAALGAKPSGGYDIMIESADEDSTGIEVSVVRSSP